MIPLVLSHAQPEAGGIVLPSAAINTPGVEIHQLDSGANQKFERLSSNAYQRLGAKVHPCSTPVRCV